MGGNPKSKYCCYIAQPSMLCHYYGQIIIRTNKFATSQVAQTVAFTLTLRAMNAREVTQFPKLILPAKYAGLKYILLCIDFKKGNDIYG